MLFPSKLDDEAKEVLRTRVLKARKKLGWSQAKVADHIDISQRVVARCELLMSLTTTSVQKLNAFCESVELETIEL